MFSRFTEKAIQAIMLAQEEAKRFHHSYVGTEHILLGIIGEGNNVVIKSLHELNITIDQIKLSIEERLEYGGLSADASNIPFTQQAKQVLTNAWDEARKLGHNYVNVEHLFLSIFRDPTSIAARVLAELGLTSARFKETLFSTLGDKVESSQKIVSSVPTPTVDLYGRDLTRLAKEGTLDPVIGRENEIERIIQILSRRTKNNPVLTGEPGVGKTAVVEGLSQRIQKGEVPEKPFSKRVITLDLGLLVAGTKYRGEFEDRVKKIMEEVRKAQNIILFIDELHTIIGTGSSEGSLDAANLFKPALARGELQCIGATTLDEYRKHIEGDGALERRFQSVLIEEPSAEESVEILRGIKERYEEFHDVTITDESLEEAVTLSTRYITDRQLPDKAVDLIDEAASKIMLKASRAPQELKTIHDDMKQTKKELEIAKKKNDETLKEVLIKKEKELKEAFLKFPKEQREMLNKVVTPHTIAEVVAVWTGVPVTKISLEETNRLVKMEEEIKRSLVGQDDAVTSIVRAVKRAKIGLKDPNRPTGSFLFLGPTGVGKSELAKILADYLFGSRESMIRIDMSEYMERHTVSRLIGSPPGYVGYNEGGQLSEPVRRRPYSIVLFDELEKAHPDVINILLQVLEDGRLTDSNGRTVNFKNTIIIMTSNVGAKFIQTDSSFGFTTNDNEEEHQFEGIKAKITDELHREFKPEFLNRIDDTVIFRPLQKDSISVIVGKMLTEVKNRLIDKQMFIKWDKKVETFLVENGYNQKQGARPLRRAIQEHFEDRLADDILTHGLRSSISVTAQLKKDRIEFDIKKLTKAEVKKRMESQPKKESKRKPTHSTSRAKPKQKQLATA